MIWRWHIHKVVLCLPDSWSNGNLEMLVFEERGKPEYPEKNLLEQRREPTMALFVSLCFYELPLYQILDPRCLPTKYLMEDWVIL